MFGFHRHCEVKCSQTDKRDYDENNHQNRTVAFQMSGIMARH